MEGSVVELAKANPRLKEVVAKTSGGERIKYCMTCGVCSGDCPVRFFVGGFSPIRIIMMTLLGLEKDVLESDQIWLCAYCYLCHERCPKQVRFPEVLLTIRNMAVRGGNVPLAYTAFSKLLYDTGRSLELNEFVLDDRDMRDLPPIGLTIPEDALGEVRKIMERTGLTKVVELGGE